LQTQCFDAVGWAAGRASGLKKTDWWGAGMVICLERGADLRMAQLMLLPLTVSCFSQIGFTFLVPAHLGSPRKRAVKRVCVCVCVLQTRSPRRWRRRQSAHHEHLYLSELGRRQLGQYLVFRYVAPHDIVILFCSSNQQSHAVTTIHTELDSEAEASKHRLLPVSEKI